MAKIASLSFVVAFFLVGKTWSQSLELRSPQITNWGDWALFDDCPDGEFITGMQLKTQSYQGGLKDDSALNGIKFFCGSLGSKSNQVSVLSGEGSLGDFGQEYFCEGAATGFQLRSEKYQTVFADDTAANNIRLFCNSNSSTLVEGDGLGFGDWTAAQGCFKKQALCGYSSQVDNDLGSGELQGIGESLCR